MKLIILQLNLWRVTSYMAMYFSPYYVRFFENIAPWWLHFHTDLAMNKGQSFRNFFFWNLHDFMCSHTRGGFYILKYSTHFRKKRLNGKKMFNIFDSFYERIRVCKCIKCIKLIIKFRIIRYTNLQKFITYNTFWIVF